MHVSADSNYQKYFYLYNKGFKVFYYLILIHF